MVNGDVLANLMDEAKGLFFKTLTEPCCSIRAGAIRAGELDWLNGNRTVLVDPNLTGMIVGLTLGMGREYPCPD